jgi:hypothetical protein
MPPDDGIPRFGTPPIETFIESSREAAVALDDIEDRAPDLANDLQADRGKTTAIEPNRNLSDDEFDTFTEARRESPVLRFDGNKRANVVKSRAVDDADLPPDPREVHEARSEAAQQQDESLDARVTVDPAQYASDPDSFDFPGVDTGPGFESVYGDDLSSNRFDKVEERVQRDGPFNPLDTFDIFD